MLRRILRLLKRWLKLLLNKSNNFILIKQNTQSYSRRALLKIVASISVKPTEQLQQCQQETQIQQPVSGRNNQAVGLVSGGYVIGSVGRDVYIDSSIRESDESRQIFDSQIQEAIVENTGTIAGIIPDFDLRKYQEGIRERYGNLKLDSLDTSGYAYNELKLWRIFIPQNVREVHEVLPQVHEIPKEYQRRLRDSNQLEEQLSQKQLESCKKTYYQQRPCWVFEIWNDQQKTQCVVILGDPGSGKSTLLQYMALEWAQEAIQDLLLLPIPLLIELRTYIRNRDYGNCKDFLEFFHKGSGIICRLNQLQLHEYLKTGNAVVMFDGLDEIFDPAKREDAITDIHRFTKDYPKVQVIVTSRIIGYNSKRLRDAGFRHFMLQDLEQYQINDFIHRWHELTFNNEEEKVRKRNRLQAAINTSSAIRELAGNPLLLTMMAILNRNQELPRDRAELYNQASRVLLHQWDVERALLEDYRLDPKTIDYKDKQAMLRLVAYHMQATEKGLPANLIAGNDLEKFLTDYLKTIEVSEPRIVARLMKEQLRSRNFILCFLGADYYAFVHRTFLEYFCAWEFVWQFKETQSLSIEQLKTEIFGKHYQDDAWQEVLRLIAGMIEPKFVSDIIDYLIEQNSENKSFTNLFLAASCLLEVRNRSSLSNISTKLLKEFQVLIEQKSFDEKLRIKGILAIASTWKNYPETLSFLNDLAQSNHTYFVRQEAVLALAEISKNSSEALSILKNLAQSGDETATIALVRNWSYDPDTLTILKNLAQSSNEIAMTELVRGWSDDPNISPTLKNLAQFSTNETIKNTALETLVRYWIDDPGIIRIVKAFAQSGNEIALDGLVYNWRSDPDTLTILKNLAQSGNEMALTLLQINWGSDPDTLTFLENLAQSSNEMVFKAKLAVTSVDKLSQKKNKLKSTRTGKFSHIRTKLTDIETLIASLHSLGYTFKTNSNIRGYSGQRVRSDIVVVLEGDYDLGFSHNGDGSLDLITDFAGISKKYNQTEFINSITQRYGAMLQGYRRFVN